jgi:hypothetical protein
MYADHATAQDLAVAPASLVTPSSRPFAMAGLRGKQVLKLHEPNCAADSAVRHRSTRELPGLLYISPLAPILANSVKPARRHDHVIHQVTQ